MIDRLSRREVLQAFGAAALGVGVTEVVANPQAVVGATSADRKRAVRIAHLTDIHIQPERNANVGFVSCLKHVQSHADKPELILTGGDSIMDSLEADDARTQVQWDLWNGVLKNECSLPLLSCLGNHDIWGWNKRKSNTTGSEPNHGKQRAVDMLKMPKRYFSETRHGWHFIMLDSTQPDGDGYVAYIDDEQFDWLERDLRDTPATTPVLLMSHIPIMSITTLLWAKEEKGEFTVDTSLMHRDCLKLKNLFAKHPNVKLCLSGHMHLIDRVDYNGVTYLCNGAVSANWWKGRHKDCDEGYAVIDLFDDGSFDQQYVKYGWKAEA